MPASIDIKLVLKHCMTYQLPFDVYSELLHCSPALHLQNWQQGKFFILHGHTLTRAHFIQLHGSGKSSGKLG